MDQLFGWGCAWIESYIQEAPIYGMKDLLKCYKAGAQDMVDTDPDGPKFHIQRFDPGENRPQPRTFFQRPTTTQPLSILFVSLTRSSRMPMVHRSRIGQLRRKTRRNWTMKETFYLNHGGVASGVATLAG